MNLRMSVIAFSLGLVLVGGCGHGRPPPEPTSVPQPISTFVPDDGSVLLIVGQDLASVRGYLDSGCCPKPAGTTTYLGLYNLRSAEGSYGGLGVTDGGEPYAVEVDWGGGPTHLVRAAELTAGVLAVGLDMTNHGRPGALQRVPEGDFDAEIDHLARTLASLSRPVLLRIGYEFDGTWNPGYHDRGAYVRAYRHIAERIRRSSATNVAFVWQSSASLVDDIIERRHERIEDWYPGDDVVDWVGLSWFLSPDTVSPVGSGSARDLIEEVVAFARARGKPAFIAEASPQGYHLSKGYRANIAPVLDGPSGLDVTAKTGEEIWSAWYRPFFEYIEANRDVIRAVAYINAHWDAQGLWDSPYENGFWGDSRVQTNKEVSSRWRAELQRPHWRHGGADLFERIGFAPRPAGGGSK